MLKKYILYSALDQNIDPAAWLYHCFTFLFHAYFIAALKVASLAVKGL